ncbi:MAG: cytochrome P450 family protein [Trebonia sp.]
MASTRTKLDEQLMRDPKALFERLWVNGPVQPVVMPDGVPGWLVIGHAEARALLTDQRLSKNLKRALDLFPELLGGGYGTALDENMLNADPPDHTRLRALVNKAFTSRAVAGLAPRIEQIADELLDGMIAGQIDLIEAFAFPLPVTVICELLGAPVGDRALMRDWSRAFTSNMPGDVVGRAAQEMLAYLRALAGHKRAEPGRDLLSELIAVSEDGDRLTDDEIVAMVFLLVVAGHETTVSLLASGVLGLLRHPDQLALLRSRPELMPGAIEEFLRFESPVNIATLRYTTEPVRVGEVEIPAGEFVLISLLAANNDSAKFADPKRLDVTREAGGHVAFGHGIHHCVGAPLARLEARIALGRLLARFDDISLAGSPDELAWRDSTLIHGLQTLPVRIG